MGSGAAPVTTALAIAMVLLANGCASHRSKAPVPPPQASGPIRNSPTGQPVPYRPLPPTGGAAKDGRVAESWYPRGRPISPRWTHIVIHHSATAVGGARSFDAGHRANGWDEMGYHFVIGNGTQTPDGFIEVGSRWDKQKHGAHCKTPNNYFNDHGIGICLVGDFTKGKPTRNQLSSLYRLSRFLSRACGIPVDRITTHAGVTHKTACPGRFPIQPLRDALSSAALASNRR